MKLSTLLQYQKAFNLLKSLDMQGKNLTIEEYKIVLKAMIAFDVAMATIVGNQMIEVSA